MVFIIVDLFQSRVESIKRSLKLDSFEGYCAKSVPIPCLSPLFLEKKWQKKLLARFSATR
jgi:hypothetical protein